MGVLRFLSLAAAAVLLVEAEEAKTPLGVGGVVVGCAIAVSANCRSEMNAARSLAGFSALEAATGTSELLPILTDAQNYSVEKTPNQTYLNTVCGAMRKNEVGDVVITPEGTYAFAVQTGDQVDCQAAVDYWKEAFTNFGGLPPAYDSTLALYKDPKNVSFISMFNPKGSAKVDCAYFTCPAAANQPTAKGSTAGETDLKALLCVTTPKALTAQQNPYDQAQWDKITAALTSASSAAFPALLAVTAAALGVAIF